MSNFTGRTIKMTHSNGNDEKWYVWFKKWGKLVHSLIGMCIYLYQHNLYLPMSPTPPHSASQNKIPQLSPSLLKLSCICTQHFTSQQCNTYFILLITVSCLHWCVMRSSLLSLQPSTVSICAIWGHIGKNMWTWNSTPLTRDLPLWSRNFFNAYFKSSCNSFVLPDIFLSDSLAQH